MHSRRYYFTNKKFLITLLAGLLLFSLSLVINFYANAYTTRSISGFVGDIILSNTRVYDVDGIFIYGVVLLIAIVAYLSIHRPQRLPFIFKSYALFVIIRAVFITLTHVSPYPIHAEISSVFWQAKIFRGIFTGAGLFFSGHTGAPFLFAIMFWNDKFWRYVFLVFSFVLAAAVLLGHLHYSIDVFGAYFITYAIFHMSEKFFKKDWLLFQHGL